MVIAGAIAHAMNPPLPANGGDGTNPWKSMIFRSRHDAQGDRAKIEDYNSTRDRVSTIVESKLALKNPDAMVCDAVHLSTGHAEVWKTARLAMCTR